MGTNDEPLQGSDAPPLRAYCGDEPDVLDHRRFSEPMRRARRARARVEAYRAARDSPLLTVYDCVPLALPVQRT